MSEAFPHGSNPAATADEQRAADVARRLWSRSDVRAARDTAAYLWRLAYGESWQVASAESFESAMDEYAFNYVLKAVASDGQYPRFVRNFMPPHDWFDAPYPGARMGGDNPDNCYRLAGIEHGSQYEVHGSVVGRAPSSVSFTLVANYGTSVTIQTLEYGQLQTRADGSFLLTVGDGPGAPGGNHLRTAPSVKFLFVRDTMMSWNDETPLALRIRKIGAPTREPIDEDVMAGRAAHRMVEDVPLYYWFTRLFSGKPVNTIEVNRASGKLGGLVTQAGAQGRVRIAFDEAAIVRVDPAGAAYSAIVYEDWWFRTPDYRDRLVSLTTAMSAPEPDGCVTYVVSAQDPGVHNWIDIAGHQEVLLMYRWQGLPATAIRNGPHIDPVRVVKLDALSAHLPPGMVRIEAYDRAEQLRQRAVGFDRRLEYA